MTTLHADTPSGKQNPFKNKKFYIQLILAFQLLFTVQVVTLFIRLSAEELTITRGVIASGIGFGLLIQCVWLTRRNNRSQKGEPFTWLTSILCFLAIIVMIVAANLIGLTLGFTPEHQRNQDAVDQLVQISPLFVGIVVAGLAPLVEELVFRDILPRAFGGNLAAFILSSLLFSALHTPGGWFGWSSYLILSAGFLFARLKTKSLYAAIFVHAAWNLLTLII